MSYSKEFPDFVLDVVIPAGFEDTSWHNDTCPSWEHPQLNLKLWIEYANPEDREVAELPRYAIGYIDGDNIECSDDYFLVLQAIMHNELADEIQQTIEDKLTEFDDKYGSNEVQAFRDSFTWEMTTA